MTVCGQCGRENPGDARFCNSCGAPLAAQQRMREERKVVTAVFVDLVGSTARAEQLDPEDVRALLRRYHETLRRDARALRRDGGEVHRRRGGGRVRRADRARGRPRARRPRRARGEDSIAALNDRDDALDLHVRVGVATGEALVALDAAAAAGESMVAGDVMNTAARIQAAAPVDGILVSAATHRATERPIVYREHEAVTAKGKAEPVEVWEAVEAVGRVGELARRAVHSARGARPRAGTAARGLRAGSRRSLAPARDARRRPGNRQEPARRRARAGGCRGRRDHRLALRPLPAVRRTG